MSPGQRAAFVRIQERLQRLGAVDELERIEALSVDELALLIRREQGFGMELSTSCGPILSPAFSTVSSTASAPLSPGKTQGCASSSPQGRQRKMTANHKRVTREWSAA